MEKLKMISSAVLHTKSSKLQVFLFNVGQGDHILLKFPSGEYGIIDFYYDKGIPEPPALSYFKDLQFHQPEEFARITIAFFCISHTDKDHVKGVAKMLEWFKNNNVFIKDFWLGAARDEAQFFNFLKEKIPAEIDKLDIDQKVNWNKPIEAYSNGISDFFRYFEKWKRGQWNGARYQSEDIGGGEYLAEIRPLRKPCSVAGSKAINMGPLGPQVDDYINNLSFDIIQKILGVDLGESLADKNLMSHILRIQFGETNMLFGGDTDKKIWEECLERYHDKSYSYLECFGSCQSPFIKVSHHGSRDSSSHKIWEKILPGNRDAYLGISAGQHKKYRHPHSDTIEQIRALKKDAHIFATNICSPCVWEDAPEKEWHSWYDEYLQRQKMYKKTRKNENDSVIDKVFSSMPNKENAGGHPAPNAGLLGYIFEISEKADEPIRVRTALCASVKGKSCFYTLHQEKLCKKCYNGL